ncbi:hypothetical protein [Helicobacter pylori]|uniref:hypothetical protein n=1 Tax=Helicobacter pylori TaxID=210 RepID=UPI000429C37A|nr:hypothetical protein [Helicobacter pylori]
MIDQLQIIPKTQALEDNTMETSLSVALQKASIPKLVSAYRNALINHFLEQVILQSQFYKKQQYKKSIVFGDVIKFNPYNKNPLLKPYNAFIVLSCTQFHNSRIHLVAPYKNNSIIFELLHCIDFQTRDFERQQSVQLNPKEIKTQILEHLKL